MTIDMDTDGPDASVVTITDDYARSGPERIAVQARWLRGMGRVVEVVGWLTLALGVVIGGVVGAARDDAIYSATQETVHHPMNGVMAFLAVAFASLILLVLGRSVALFAEHVAYGVGVDLYEHSVAHSVAERLRPYETQIATGDNDSPHGNHRCPNGHEIKPGSTFCGTCGAALEAATPASDWDRSW